MKRLNVIEKCVVSRSFHQSTRRDAKQANGKIKISRRRISFSSAFLRSPSCSLACSVSPSGKRKETSATQPEYSHKKTASVQTGNRGLPPLPHYSLKAHQMFSSCHTALFVRYGFSFPCGQKTSLKRRLLETMTSR